MAFDLTFIEGVAVATLVFAILAVLCVVPYLLVAFGFFPDSGFARRVYLSTGEELQRQTHELTAIRDDIRALRENSGFQFDWSEIQTDDALVTIAEHLKEKMD